jgi:hypothetical protein
MGKCYFQGRIRKIIVKALERCCWEGFVGVRSKVWAIGCSAFRFYDQGFMNMRGAIGG